MKKILQLLAIAAMSFTIASCSDVSLDESENALTPLNESVINGRQRRCASMEVLAKQMEADVTLQARMDAIENQTSEFEKNQKSSRVGATGILTIPVVVNILFSNTKENISATQIQTQIDVLNRDFGGTNTDRTKIPKVFGGLFSNMQIAFKLHSVVRKTTKIREWSIDNDNMKILKNGGIAATTPTTKLNIWVCNLGEEYLGYAQFPGDKAETDGVVINFKCFGTTGTAVAPFNKGRTGTHEVGHWLNLHHIWGDHDSDIKDCNDTDFVSDTPTQGMANGGCPKFPSPSCGNKNIGDMFMNYMDYVDDACMVMFTAGQKTRTRALFAPKGARASFNP